MFTGSYTALITPFSNDQVDEKALRQIVDWQIDNGSNGLVPMGTTGESSTVTPAEHQAVVKIVIDQCAGRVPVIAGAGSNNPREALHYVQFAQQAGADGVLCVAGYYNRPTQQGLYQHFEYLHNNSDIPIIVYNVPARTAVDITPDTMAEIALLPRVVGVKDATADLARISQEQMRIDTPFDYLSGEDITSIAYNAMGGSGCISVTANIAPRHCADMQAACTAGDYATARAIHQQLLPLQLAVSDQPNSARVKFALALAGLCQNELRLPLLPISREQGKAIETAMADLDLL